MFQVGVHQMKYKPTQPQSGCDRMSQLPAIQHFYCWMVNRPWLYWLIFRSRGPIARDHAPESVGYRMWRFASRKFPIPPLSRNFIYFINYCDPELTLSMGVPGITNKWGER
jgi:hypothetical protein